MSESLYEKQKNCKHNKNASYDSEGTFCKECGLKLSLYAISEIQSLTAQRDQLNEKLKEVCIHFSQRFYTDKIEQQRKEIMGEE